MYPFKQAKVLLGLHVPQVGNACFRELHVELNLSVYWIKRRQSNLPRRYGYL